MEGASDAMADAHSHHLDITIDRGSSLESGSSDSDCLRMDGDLVSDPGIADSVDKARGKAPLVPLPGAGREGGIGLGHAPPFDFLTRQTVLAQERPGSCWPIDVIGSTRFGSRRLFCYHPILTIAVASLFRKQMPLLKSSLTA